MIEALAQSFRRARRPEQVTQRREAILAAAAALFDEAGPEGAGLNAIAARAGFTKSNVYRYFESREAVLLELFFEDFRGLVTDIEARLAFVPTGNVEAAAHALAAAFLARPRLCKLMGILSGVLERNVSEANVLALKTGMVGFAERAAAALARTLPQLSLADCGWAAATTATYVAGLWPSTSPSPAVARVMARPELALVKPVAERDLERTVLVLLRGLERSPARPPR